MLMVLAKLEELKIPFYVAAVISDFELNIVKSVDELLEVDVEGCFFHFTSCLMNKVDKKLSKDTLGQGTVVQGYFSQKDSYPRDSLSSRL